MEKVNLEWAEKCLAFIDKSVSCYHAVEQVEKRLSENGFVQLDERSLWEVVPGGSYYVKRGDSSLAAFQIPDLSLKGFHITASHSDSPCFKIKTNPEMMLENKYLKLNVEGYGGMIQSTWFDRCLSVAGRVVCTGENGLQTVTVNVDEDLLVIPNLAIHMNRSINKGVELNIQTDLLPLMGGPGAKARALF